MKEETVSLVPDLSKFIRVLDVVDTHKKKRDGHYGNTMVEFPKIMCEIEGVLIKVFLKVLLICMSFESFGKKLSFRFFVFFYEFFLVDPN